MNLRLETEIGTLSFDFEANTVYRIINEVVKIAAEEKTNDDKKILENAEKIEKKEKPKEEKKSCVERDLQMEETKKPDAQEIYEEGYSGFLHIKCDRCGEIHTYCSKEKSHYSKCQCGCKTKLENLRRVYVECKCGGHFRYFTNIEDDSFEIPCFECGSPVDLHINERKNAFITVKDRIHPPRGGRKQKR